MHAPACPYCGAPLAGHSHQERAYCERQTELWQQTAPALSPVKERVVLAPRPSCTPPHR